MKILITGGSNGIGKGVATILAAADNHSHEVILLCRSEHLARITIQEIEERSGNQNVSAIICDLARLSDVKKAVREIRKQHDSLDAIFINAGLGYAAGRVETEDGLDSHFQVNYLSHFLLTLNVLSLLENSRFGGRVIFNATNFGHIQWDDLQMKKKWSYEQAIFQAMAAKRMFLHRLDSVYAERKSPRISFVGFEVHKTVWTNQLNIIPKPMKVMATIMKFFGTFISMEECGKQMKPLFLEPQWESLKKSGKLFTWKKDSFSEIREGADILDPANQERLWQISLDLCRDQETSKIAAELVRLPGSP